MPFLPVLAAERSKACTVFARSEAGILGLNPTQGMGVWCLCVCVCVCVCACVFLCLYTGRGLTTSWSPAQGVLPNVQDLVNRSETESFMEVGQGPKCAVAPERGKSVIFNLWLRFPNNPKSSLTRDATAISWQQQVTTCSSRFVHSLTVRLSLVCSRLLTVRVGDF
jgi:hypothetical protein